MMENKSKKAVVLLSGGLNSATVLAIAKSEGYEIYALSFSYGQRHSWELEAAGCVARSLGVAQHRIATIDLRASGGSALTDDIGVPKGRAVDEMSHGIPIAVQVRHSLRARADFGGDHIDSGGAIGILNPNRVRQSA
jgi:7-cyano-7-deazaguanine synthase